MIYSAGAARRANKRSDEAKAKLCQVALVSTPSDDPTPLDLAAELSKRDKNVMLAMFRELAKGSSGIVSVAPNKRAGESLAANAELTKDKLDWTAYDTGRESQGRRLRRLQDEAAEAGQE